jgi:ribosomal-protein-alanine N-acetyltransferase
LGKALLEHLIGEAKHRRARSLFLEVRASNHVAAALYAGLGFNEIGRRPGYYPLDGRRREDALVMGKELF